MGIRICTITVFQLRYIVAAAQSPSQAQSTMLLAMAVQAPPVAQPPRVPGEPPRTPQSPPVSRPPESPKNDQIHGHWLHRTEPGSSLDEGAPQRPVNAHVSGKASGTSKVSKFILTNPKLQEHLQEPRTARPRQVLRRRAACISSMRATAS